jgi:hypothetical protein
MTKTLFLPEHVAQKIKADRGGASTELPTPSAEDSLNKAYVEAADRFLDPALLDKPLLERLPQPTGWRVLVMPYQTAVQTRGGLRSQCRPPCLQGSQQVWPGLRAVVQEG